MVVCAVLGGRFGRAHAAEAAGGRASGELTLAPAAPCFAPGAHVVVEVWATALSDPIVGGQFRLAYDTSRIAFVDIAPGDALFSELYRAVDDSAGEIDYAVNAPPGHEGTGEDVVLAVITFSTLEYGCEIADLLWFREATPPTRLTVGGGEPIYPALHDLCPVRVEDEAPLIECPGDVSVSSLPTMHFAQLPDGAGWAIDATWPHVVAEDWVAPGDGVFDAISFWGAWQGDDVGSIECFHFSIHANVPAGGGGVPYARPGAALVAWTAHSFEMVPATEESPPAFSGWHDPHGGVTLSDDHVGFARYTVSLPTAFAQSIGETYWLLVSAEVADPAEGVWGWRNSIAEHGGRGVFGADPAYSWEPLSGAVETDLAFRLHAWGEVEPGVATATDNCTPGVTPEVSERVVPGASPQSYVVERVWRAADTCELVGECVQSLRYAAMTLSLEPEDACPDDVLRVQIWMKDAAEYVAGGQFRVVYDTEVLEFVGAESGDPLFSEFYEYVDPSTGVIDHAVRAPYGELGTMDDTMMAVLTFGIRGEVPDTCVLGDLLHFRPAAEPPTRLTSPDGMPLYPILIDFPEVSLDRAPPVFSGCPEDIEVDADAGEMSAVVTWAAPTASDNCALASLTSTHAPGDTFPIGTTTVVYTAVDACGNVSECVFDVVVLNQSLAQVVVELAAVHEPVLTRCVTFEVWNCADLSHVVVEQEVEFETVVPYEDNNAIGIATFHVPAGTYSCITARDSLHTLRRTDEAMGISGSVYVADFSGDPLGGGDWLIGGDANDDGWVDIVDYGVLTWQWATIYGDPASGDTACGTPYPHPDFSGNGGVEIRDFTYIQVNFLDGDEANCCGRGVAEAGLPREMVALCELEELGLAHLAVADLDGDGWLTAADLSAFMQGKRPSTSPERLSPVAPRPSAEAEAGRR